MKVILVSSIAIACYLVCPWQWLSAEEAIKYPSPDGRFALRITESNQAELIENASGRLMVDLGSPGADRFWSGRLIQSG